MTDISIHYFNGRPNFGDLLNTYIPQKLFNCNIIKGDLYTCDAAFVGSILTPFVKDEECDLSLPPLKIWGSGFIKNVDLQKQLIRKVEVYAVRGKLTKEYLEKFTETNLKKVALGDPGLLCSRIFDDKTIVKKYDWGIIPHYVDKDNPNLKKLRLPNSVVLDICEEPEVFLPKLLQCKKIISSAMHGLIAADSYGIPNIRMIVGNKIMGGDFKFNDYYSAFGITNHSKIDLRIRRLPITNINFDYKISQRSVRRIQDDLIRSFPYA